MRLLVALLVMVLIIFGIFLHAETTTALLFGWFVFLRGALPRMTVTAVCDAEEMTRLMNATLDWPHPIYIRLGKGGDPVVSKPERGFAIGKAILMRTIMNAIPFSSSTVSSLQLWTPP